MADKAELLTPLMRLRRRRRAARLFAFLLVMGLTLLGVLVLLVNDGRNYRRLVLWSGLEDYLARPFATAAPQPLRSRRASVIIDVPARLIASTVWDAAPFQQFPRFIAHERCQQIAADGGEAPTFQATGGEWECLYSHELGAVPEPSVLFIQIKGTTSSAFRTFRLKLSLLDHAQDAAMVRSTIDAIDRFGLELIPESRLYLDDKIRSGADFTSLLEGYRVTLEREKGGERRYNLLVTQLPSAKTCGDTGAPVSDSASALRMQASLASTPIDCLKLPTPGTSPPVQPD